MDGSATATFPSTAEEVHETEFFDYSVVYMHRRRAARLHSADACWCARCLKFEDFELFQGAEVCRDNYNADCQSCWPAMLPMSPALECYSRRRYVCIIFRAELIIIVYSAQ